MRGVNHPLGLAVLAGFGRPQDTLKQWSDNLMKKVPVVKIATPDAAEEMARVPLRGVVDRSR